MEDERFLKINEYYILDYYDRLLMQYLSALYSVGLDRRDYKEICKIVRELDKIRRDAYHDHYEYVRLNKYTASPTKFKDTKEIKKEYLDEVEDIRGHFEKILELIRASIKPSTIEEYLQEEVSITHLVFTNNKHPKIKLYSNDGFMFLCQSHVEKTPSLGVLNYKGYGMCFGCGWTFKDFSYIKHIERISDLEVVSLLSKVYMIDIKDNNISEDNRLVQKYRSSLLSSDYRSLLERAYERTSKKESNIMNSLALAKFDRDFATIDRVKRGEYIQFDGETEKGKKLKLSL